MHAHQKSFDIINVVILKYLLCNFVRITVEKSTLEKNFIMEKTIIFTPFLVVDSLYCMASEKLWK